MDGMLRSLVVLSAALVLVVVGRGAAKAHAGLVSTSPEDGSRIASAVACQFTFTATEDRLATHEAAQEEAPSTESFVDRHGNLLVVGLALAVLAIGVMLAPLMRGRRE